MLCAHRKELDFESVLDESRTIAPCPEVLMKVLYAHTRAVSILNFCLNPSFTMLSSADTSVCTGRIRW